MQYLKILKLQQVNPNFVCIFIFRIESINCSFLFIFHFKFHAARFIRIFQKFQSLYLLIIFFDY